MLSRGYGWVAAIVALCLLPAGSAQAAKKPPRADLSVSSVTNPPTTATPGASFAVTGVTRNKGRARARGSLTRFFLSADSKVNRGDLRLGEQRVPALRRGRKSSKVTRLKIPSFVSAGTYRILACADRLGKVRESSERNNCKATRGRVRVVRTAVGSPGTGTGPGTAPAPALGIAPSEQAFAAAVGVSHGPITFTVTNSGKAASGALVTDVTGADAAMFKVSSDTCAGKSLAIGTSCTLNVTFTPTSLGAKSASLHVAATPGGLAAAALKGTGQTAANLGISPTSQAFADTGIGSTSAATTFTVTNNGQAASGALTTTLTGLDAAHFEITRNNCAGLALAGGASCTVGVAFKPTGTGGKTATLRVAGNPGGTVNSNLTGTGLTAAALVIEPASRDFGTIPIGGSSAFTFTVGNTGQATSGPVSVAVAGTDASQFTVTGDTCTGNTVAGAATCSVQVTFMPSGSATPPGRSASLRVSATPGTPAGNPASAALTGQAAPATLSVSGPPHGTTNIGSSVDQPYTVTNSGAVATGALAVSITPQGSDFSVVDADPAGPNNCTGYALPAGASCTMNVRFSPTAAGPRSATLQVSGTPGGAASAPLSGTGLAPGPAVLTLTPETRDYGTIPSGGQGDFAFTVTNTGQSASGTISQAVSGTGFSLVTENCSTLLPTQTCAITVRFTSSGTVGTVRNGTLSVSATGTSDSSTLIGRVG